MTLIKYGHRNISSNMHIVSGTCYYCGSCRLYDENGQKTEKKFVYCHLVMKINLLYCI